MPRITLILKKDGNIDTQYLARQVMEVVRDECGSVIAYSRSTLLWFSNTYTEDIHEFLHRKLSEAGIRHSIVSIVNPKPLIAGLTAWHMIKKGAVFYYDNSPEDEYTVIYMPIYTRIKTGLEELSSPMDAVCIAETISFHVKQIVFRSGGLYYDLAGDLISIVPKDSLDSIKTLVGENIPLSVGTGLKFCEALQRALKNL
ncbi:hypothetical protein ACSU1N_05265 [Thermogladius sp. 4427co]|uniref:hypothetical protein n=1 Tax=Thermogladius sp. 4427co TaxID=3450718 RepID=UPI003F7A9516